MLSDAARRAAEEAAACCPEQSAYTEAHGQAGAHWEQTTLDQQLQMPPVKWRLLLPPTLLPPASVSSDCSPSADLSCPAKGAVAAADTATDSVTAASPQSQKGLSPSPIVAQQSMHQGLSHPGLAKVSAAAEHTAERDSSVAFSVPVRSDRQGASAAAAAASRDTHTTAVPAAVLAGSGHGFKWHFQPGTSKLLVEVDTSLIHHSRQIDAAFTHVAQAVKGLPPMLSCRGPAMPTTGSAARWSSLSPHATVTQAASSEEVSIVLSLTLLAKLYGRVVVRRDSELVSDNT